MLLEPEDTGATGSDKDVSALPLVESKADKLQY